jgi:IPT/TIG domain
MVIASTINTTGTPSLISVQAPSGITTTTPLPLSVPSGGASLTLQVSSSAVAGTLVLNGQVGSTAGSGQVPITIQAGNPPSFSFAGFGDIFELQIPVGGSGQTQLPTVPNNQPDYNVVLSVSGLPSGVTASLTPSVIVPGQTVTVMLTASSTAPFSQNVPVTVTGTPQAPVAAGSKTILVDVTPPSNSLPNNRTDYISTEGTPYAATYDPVHNLIFSSNPSWNRIDVISNSTHAIVKEVPVEGPRGIDISQDSSTVWVTTASQEVFAIKTSTLAATRYLLPSLPSTSGPVAWLGYQIFALSDGTVMVFFAPNTCCGYLDFAVWNPTTNAFIPLQGPSSESLQNFYPVRSGDGTQVWFIGSTSDGEVFHYNVLTQTFSGITDLGGYAVDAAVNFDGSRIVVYDASGLNMYDGSLNLLGPVPGGGVLGASLLQGGLVFGPVTGDLYEICMPTDIPVILTIDPNSLAALTIAPAMDMIPVMTELSPPFYMTAPFAIDSTGMVLGIEDYGIAFDDSTYSQNLVTTQLGPCVYMQHMSPYAGPLAGGTTSGGFGCAFPPITPAVWYGANRGVASLSIPANQPVSVGELTITSPPATVQGPVNLKFLFPDGTENFDPLFFSYGPFIRYATISGASSEGGAPGMIDGYGMPQDSSGGTLTIGGSAASITSSPAGFTSPFPSTAVSLTVPAGTPGWADVTVNTPNGTSTLPKAFFYAESVDDYSSTDAFAAILYDPTRQQLYLSAGDHIDVFSLSSNQFVSPFTPPAQGTSKQFAGLALTPDGSQLLAADLSDGSLAVINPDSPAGSFFIPIAPASGQSPCIIGPMYVAASTGNQAFVIYGEFPGIGCVLGGNLYAVNLTSKTAAADTCCGNGNQSVSASADGTKIAIAGGDIYVYNVAQQTLFSTGAAYQTGTGAISGDGNVVAQQTVFTDSSANIVGQIAGSFSSIVTPITTSSPDGLSLTSLLDPQFNASGSLYFFPHPNLLDIIDVQHGTLRMRFSLTETISNGVAPLAVDSGGQYIYLLTSKGLTIVNLGEALLSIGSLNPTSASPGTAVTVRGSGFSASIAATVGGQVATVNFIDQNTLTLTVPSVSSGPSDVVLSSGSGITYTLENGLTIQ